MRRDWPAARTIAQIMIALSLRVAGAGGAAEAPVARRGFPSVQPRPPSNSNSFATSHGDELGHDARRDLGNGLGTDVQTDRSVNAVKLLGRRLARFDEMLP